MKGPPREFACANNQTITDRDTGCECGCVNGGVDDHKAAMAEYALLRSQIGARLKALAGFQEDAARMYGDMAARGHTIRSRHLEEYARNQATRLRAIVGRLEGS